MKLDGKIEIGAPAGAVWALIVDPVSLSSCVPGVRDVRQVNDRTFAGSITAAVGPIEGDFSFTSVLSRAEFPDGLEAQVEGIDSITKSRLETKVLVSLIEMGSGATVLSYQAEMKVRGRLAILGEMILRATASLMIAQVAACLRSRLESPETGAGDAGREAGG